VVVDKVILPKILHLYYKRENA